MGILQTSVYASDDVLRKISSAEAELAKNARIQLYRPLDEGKNPDEAYIVADFPTADEARAAKDAFVRLLEKEGARTAGEVVVRKRVP